MRLIFRKLVICNFKSFKEETFDFSFMSGMTLVCGKNLDIPGQANSAGKSSIFDALLYSLFGQLQTKVKNANLKNRYANGREMFVSLNFDIGNDKKYRIQRGSDTYGRSYLHLFLIEDGKEIDATKSSIYETEAFLETEVLHCDISIFLRTILLSADNNYNFFLLSPYEKKQFVEKLFNIRVFGEMYKLIHRDILDYDKMFSVKQNELILLSKNSEDYLNKLEAFDKDVESKVSTIENEIDSLSKELEDLKTKKIEVNSVDISKIEDLTNKLADKKVELKKQRSNAQKEIDSLDRKKIKLLSVKQHNEKTAASYDSLLEKVCERCRLVVSDYYNLTNLVHENSNIDDSVKEFMAIIDKDKDIISKIEDKTAKIDNKLLELNNKLHDLTDESNKMRSAVVKVESELSFKSKEKTKLLSTINPYKELYDSNEIKLKEANACVEKLNSEYSYLKLAEAIVSQDTIKKFIIKDLIVLLNSKIKYYLMKLGARYTCKFNEDMDFTFITPDDGGETEYATFSAGERMRLSIATSFAFRDFMSTRNNFTSNVLILDEFIDSAIDTLAVNSVLQILKEISRTNNQHVLIISHRKEIDNSVFDNIVMVEKQNNISSIKYLPPEK